MLLRMLSLLLVLITLPAQAHEVRPGVGDLTTDDGILHLSLQMSAEALVAGVNLDGVSDTNDSAEAAAYDAARALEPAVLEARIREVFPEVGQALAVMADETRVPLVLDEVEVGPIGNIDLPRDTTLTLSAKVPQGTQNVRLIWPEGWGEVIVRQQGVEAPFTGFLSGGQTSAPIPVGPAQTGWGQRLRSIFQ